MAQRAHVTIAAAAPLTGAITTFAGYRAEGSGRQRRIGNEGSQVARGTQREYLTGSGGFGFWRARRFAPFDGAGLREFAFRAQPIFHFAASSAAAFYKYFVGALLDLLQGNRRFCGARFAGRAYRGFEGSSHSIFLPNYIRFLSRVRTAMTGLRLAAAQNVQRAYRPQMIYLLF